MKRIAFLFTMAVSGCLAGCEVKPMRADDLFAVTAPKLTIKKTWLGFKAEAGTNFSGSLKADYDPVTGQIHVDGNVASDVSGVVKAEGERLALMEAQREMDINRAIAQEQIRSAERVELYRTIGSVVPALVEAMATKPVPTAPPSIVVPSP